MNADSTKKIDVVVAGAGPVGLVAALVLAQAGVRILVLEKRDRLNEASKASTFHPPTLTILDRLGVYETVQVSAKHVDRIQYRTTEHGIVGNLSYDLLKGLTPHPFRKHIEQSRLTPVLLEKLRACPCATVMFGAELVGLEDDVEGVTVRIQQDGKTGVVRACFLIGTDGAHSQVRASAGIAFDGSAYPGKVVRVMTDESIESLLPGMAPITYLVNDSHSASFLRMPECWRIILRVPPDVSEEQALSDRWIFERLSGVIPAMNVLPTILGKDCYGASKRVAATYRKGNVFLSGDSAHLSNTRGGMNMNCGIHDAFHIATAMVRAVQDNDLRGLHAAAIERHRIASAYLIPRSDTMVSAEGSWIERVRALLDDKEKARDYLRQTAMLDMVEIPAT